jgi:hypothetical protein
MAVRAINMEFNLDYEVWSDPSWVTDEGKGTITVSNANIVLNLHPYSDEGALQIDFSGAEIQIQDYYVDLKGRIGGKLPRYFLMDSNRFSNGNFQTWLLGACLSPLSSL